jgi:hypothetical protein
MDTLLLFNCFQWDSEAGSFVPSAWKIMRLGGTITLVLLVAGILILLRLERKGRGGDHTGTTHTSSGSGIGPVGSSDSALQTGGLQA